MARLPDKTAQASQAKVNWQAALAEHSRWLRTVAYARLRDREAVEEVLQEVALAAVRQAAPLRDASKAAPWLYRLVVRQVLLYRRRHGRQRRLRERFADRLDRSPDQEVNDPLEWLLLDERRRHVREALERLPERDMEILLLKYKEDWSYVEIANHLGVSHSAVESRLHRARRKLRCELTSFVLAGTTR